MSGFTVFLICAALLVTGIPAGATEQPATIKKTIHESIDTRKATQQQSSQWHSKKERMKSQYFQLTDAIEAGALEAEHLQQVVQRQQDYIARMQTRIIEMEKMRQNLVPWLEELIGRMERHIDADLPFLTAERTARIAALKQVVYDPELTMGEKMRRVFEGLSVEMDYGRSVETQKEEIDFKGERLLVNVLRIGRTALLMQTLDGSTAGMYSGGTWVELPGSWGAEIQTAIEITQRKRPIEFVKLPVRGMQ